MRLAIFAFVFFVAAEGFCQPPVPTADLPRKPPAGLEGLVWNKWDTENFVVISLDRSKGGAMRYEVESVRGEVLARWGIVSERVAPCKVVLVPDASMLKKLFGLSEPKCEVKRSNSDSSESAIWVDEERISLLPSLVAECELLNGNFKPFVKRGIPVLERSASQIRNELLASSDLPLNEVLGDSKPSSDSAALARSSALACLLVRKEFGSRAFGLVAKGDAPEVHRVLGFPTPEEFAGTYSRYQKNLLGDMKDGRTPDEYLTPGR